MERILLLNKPLGLSPLQAIRLFQRQYPEYRTAKLGYAGRLDPLAEGLLLILVNEENKKKKEYEALIKSYEFEVLFGAATDSYDTLGLITSQPTQSPLSSLISLENSIKEILLSFLGKQMQPYPPYSSRTVHGKPLYKWARDGRLHEIQIPEREIQIFSLNLLSPARNASRSDAGGSSLLSSKEFEQIVMKRIAIVRGEFRQNEIRSSWQTYFSSTSLPHFPILRFRVSCSSGTYIRSLANTMGERLGIPSLAYTITRTAIGPYRLKNAFAIENVNTRLL